MVSGRVEKRMLSTSFARTKGMAAPSSDRMVFFSSPRKLPPKKEIWLVEGRFLPYFKNRRTACWIWFAEGVWAVLPVMARWLQKMHWWGHPMWGMNMGMIRGWPAGLASSRVSMVKRIDPTDRGLPGRPPARPFSCFSHRLGR